MHLHTYVDYYMSILTYESNINVCYCKLHENKMANGSYEIFSYLPNRSL